MCGIFAIISKETPKDLNKLLEASDYLKNRGPDSKVQIINDQGVFVFYRLAINDTSENGNQPMVSNKAILLCNGEIYNYKELRDEYELKCNSNSDCEVILRLYEKIGFEETVKKLYGVYAIILVDNDNVYLARDRIGVRPLYYGFSKDNELMISSVPNPIVDFCTVVNAFPPGASMIYNKHTSKFQMINKENIELSESRLEDGTKLLHDTLVNAVKKRLISDRPIGCLLSGGLDSSIVVAILAKLLGPENINTYSIGMTGSTDLYYAKKVADYLGTNHHEILFTPEEGFAVIPEVIKSLASYDITTIRASVGMYLISKYISENTNDKVIFSGEGSDEVLEGYLYFHNAPTPEDGENESVRLIKQLHLYDVLRADRCISVNGLEPRVPFLDKDFVNVALSLSAEQKRPQKGFEKYILRKAFEGYLPNEVLWRRKEGFSDGVSSVKKAWYHHIQEMVDPLIPDYLFNPNFPSKEAMYYNMIFNNIFPKYGYLTIPYWMPRWSDSKDPSGRMIQVYDEEDK
jgi:asparagine synthase (glutamine-hydrolysing)